MSVGGWDVVYLFAAYFVLWSITFGYLFALGGRQRRLEQRLAALREAGAVLSDATAQSAE
jgi:CcmD family protein